MQRLGLFLVMLGALALSGAAIESLSGAPPRAGGVAAVGLFLIILGLVFYFPQMLEDDTHATSTMRVAVMMVVSLFVVLTVKAGWGAPDLEHLKLQESWAWVLAAALGGKAAQSFAENTGPKPEDKTAPGAALDKPERPNRPRDEKAGIEETP